MNRKPLLVSLILWLSTGVCLCACCQPVKEYPPIEELMIDESAFPEGWEATEVDTEFGDLAPFSNGRAEVATAHRFVYLRSASNRFAYIEVNRYQRPQAADRNYGYVRDATFRETQWRAVCHVPDDLIFTSSYAEQYRYACCVTGKTTSCYYVAQYGVHVLEFELNDASVITYQDLSAVLEAIDEQMELALDGG
jgi:hypothetical protein